MDSWWVLAACKGGITDPWFPPVGGSGAAAKSVCATCEVQTECLLYGLFEEYGIWGGLSGRQRKALRRLLSAGRRQRQGPTRAHGTIYAYRNRGCRCGECRHANAMHQRAWRKKRTA